MPRFKCVNGTNYEETYSALVESVHYLTQNTQGFVDGRRFSHARRVVTSKLGV